MDLRPHNFSKDICRSLDLLAKSDNWHALTEQAIHPLSYYTRWGNPTVAYLENQLSLLLKKEKSLIFPSGMSAITTTLFSFVKPGSVLVIADSLYGDSTRFFLDDLSQWGVKVKVFNQTQAHTLARLCESDPIAFVYYEALSNPDLKAVDLFNIREICKKNNIISICDSTFAPPFMLKQEVDIADIVIMSLTKYIGGHSTCFGGSISCSTHHFEKIWHTQSLYGAMIDPNAAWHLSQGLKTLKLRLEKQAITASRIAHALASNNKVECVIYPGSDQYAYNSLSSSYLNHGGGVVSFVLTRGGDAIQKFLESLKVIQLSVSLGSVYSCIEHAEAMSHSMLTLIGSTLLKDTQVSQPHQALIRLSIGIEAAEDIEQDLLQALNQI